MLFLIHGGDHIKARRKLHALVDAVVAKRPETVVTMLDSESFVPEELAGLIASQGLFEVSRIAVLDQVLSEKGTIERVSGLLSDMQESHNTFILFEEKVSLDILEGAEKTDAEILHFPAAEGQKFNVFALTDALGRRDRKRLWVLFHKALLSEGEGEDTLSYISSMLFWQVKSMLLAASAATAEAARLKPFPFQKAKQSLKNYSLEEVKSLSSKLVALVHDSRRGIHDLETALERFVLSI